jgi:REP element-mobilizing transposase RayT
MNKYNSNIHHRRSVRLKTYDYTQEGLYFITICVKNRRCDFGKITDGNMQLSLIGEIVRNEWLETFKLRPNLKMHNYVVMPNHFHGILEIVCCLVLKSVDSFFIAAKLKIIQLKKILKKMSFSTHK